MTDIRLTGSQILKYYEQVLKKEGKSMADFSKSSGIKLPTFSWWKTHEDLSPKIDIVYKMAEFAGISLNEIVGMDESVLPEDIKRMEKMLISIPAQERLMISMNIKNYYDVTMEKKESIHSAR